VFGGVGTGLYTMLLYVLLAVFIGGLMVGRTPEYLARRSRRARSSSSPRRCWPRR
jgi:K+-transporting ATPase ATPase A chain